MTDRRAAASPAKLDKILATVRDLMNRIEDERLEDGPEKDLMREHAERLMREYRIEESELIASDLAAGRAPISVPGVRRFRICRADSGFRSQYLRIVRHVAQHCEVRSTADWERDGEGVGWWVAILVGYEGDTRYAEALYTEAQTFFGNRMEPKVSAFLSDEENVYRLRSAGVERRRISVMMGWGDTHSAHGKVAKMYKAECERRGETAAMSGRGNSMKTFREAFAEEFPITLKHRLWMARQASDSEGGALVLASRKEAVDEEFYRLFPDLRPVAVAKTNQTPVKAPKWTRADEAKWQRLNESKAALLGKEAAERAVREINIKNSNANRIEER